MKTEIDGAGPLTNDLISTLNGAVDQAEDSGSETILFLQVVGSATPHSIEAWPGDIELHAVNRWERLMRRIERANFITMCLVEGACSALALELLLVCDRRWASDDFSMRLARATGGIWPGMSLYRLTTELGQRQTRKLFLELTVIDASTAEELTIVDEVLEDPVNIFDRVSALLQKAPLQDFAVRRRLMQDSLTTGFDEALGAHLAACDRQFRRSSAANNEHGSKHNLASAV
ncbi:MAG TPA: enoyl-CoA-hydratase DpgB [Bryobacteraceae bacterium]|nr:enoyl-CoA-hydratase DpgB [Bryobacteraceae bacterium]